MQRRFLVIVLAVAACDLLKSDPPRRESTTRPTPADPAKTNTETESAEDPTVGMTEQAKTWVDFMRRTMPTMLCEQTYTKTCFTFGPGDCERLASNHFERCLKTHRDKVPSEPNATNGAEAGRVLGECTGNDFEVALTAAGKGIKSAECDAERAKVLSLPQ